MSALPGGWRVLFPLGAALLCAPLAVAQENAEPSEVFEGTFPEGGGDFLSLPFEVTAGTRELEVRRVIVDEEDVIDFGVRDPAGFRGWSGGNSEPAIIGEEASSRSYHPGPLEVGTWEVVLGRARVGSPPAEYRVEVTLRSEPTLVPDDTRRPWDAPVVEEGPRWYAGDFHVHSEDSGDAHASLDEIAALAKEKGLDFVVVTDHNTTSHHARLSAATARHPGFLFVPGVELTTYAGHATVVGARAHEDHRVEPGRDIDDVLRPFVEQGAFLSVNHPVLDLGELCIGCAWLHDEDRSLMGGVEIATGGWAEAGFLFTLDAMAFWDVRSDEGVHLAALGGSDDHRAGVDLGLFQSPIGNPTTMVFADELSEAGILEALRNSRTVVKLQGPEDPMVELSTTPPREGDTVIATEATLTATVTGGVGFELVFVEDGFPIDGERYEIDSDPFEASLTVVVEPGRRYRAEVWGADRPHTVTGNVWTVLAGDDPPPGCGCRASGEGSAAGLLGCLALLAIAARGPSRRRPRAPRAPRTARP